MKKINEIVQNWEEMAEDMIADGLPMENIIVIISRQFLVLSGLLTNALIEAGLIPSDTIVLDNDKAAFVD